MPPSRRRSASPPNREILDSGKKRRFGQGAIEPSRKDMRRKAQRGHSRANRQRGRPSGNAYSELAAVSPSIREDTPAASTHLPDTNPAHLQTLRSSGISKKKEERRSCWRTQGSCLVSKRHGQGASTKRITWQAAASSRYGRRSGSCVKSRRYVSDCKH